MKKDDISRLLQRYLFTKEEGKEPYFDADEFDELLDSFEESNDYTYYDEVLALGLKLHPGNSALQIKQCRQFLYNEEYDNALALLDTIVDADNQDLDMIRLECLCSTGQYPKVVEVTEELIAKECEYIEDVFEYITPLLNDLDMTAEARDYADRGLTLFPDNLILKNELCYILEAEGDIPKAIELCNELIDKNPFSYEYWFTLGRLHSMNAEYDKAIEAFDFALTCDDSDVELRILKAYCLYMNESYEKAIEEYLDIEGDEEIMHRIKPLMAECYIKLEDFEEAYKLLSSIIDEENLEDGATTYINYIRCCAETNRDQEAAIKLQQATKRYPENIRLLTLFFLTLIQNGEEEKAELIGNKIFQLVETTKTSPEDNESLALAAEFLYSNQTNDKAAQYYKRIVNLKSNTPTLHMHMAKVALETGDMEKFMEHLRNISVEDLLTYIQDKGVDLNMIMQEMKKDMRTVSPHELVKDFLKNKDNKN